MSAIYAALHVDGVNRVELLNPTADVVLTQHKPRFVKIFPWLLGALNE